MSHTAVHASVIDNVNQAFLEEAVQFAAEDNQGSVERDSDVANYVGQQKQKCPLVVRSARVPHGVGVKVVDGVLTFVGDSYVFGWDEIKNSIVKHYSCLAIRTASGELGMSTECYEDGSDTIIELEVA